MLNLARLSQPEKLIKAAWKLGHEGCFKAANYCQLTMKGEIYNQTGDSGKYWISDESDQEKYSGHNSAKFKVQFIFLTKTVILT